MAVGRPRIFNHNDVLDAMHLAKRQGYWRVFPHQLVAFMQTDQPFHDSTLWRCLNKMVEAKVIIRHRERLGYSLMSSGTIESRIVDLINQRGSVYVDYVADHLCISRNTARSYLDNLAAQDIIQERNGNYRLA